MIYVNHKYIRFMHKITKYYTMFLSVDNFSEVFFLSFWQPLLLFNCNFNNTLQANIRNNRLNIHVL